MAARIDTGIVPTGQDRIQGLDELRGIAVLWVVLLHSWGSFSPSGPVEVFAHRIISAGWLGVDLFFALSGFLITRILLVSRERADYFLVFYWRRSLRIFPLYFAVLRHIPSEEKTLPTPGVDLGEVEQPWRRCAIVAQQPMVTKSMRESWIHDREDAIHDSPPTSFLTLLHLCEA